MILGIAQIELFIPLSQSLKSKRKILQSLKTRIRERFNVSVCEADYQEKWQRSLLVVAHVGTEKKPVHQVLDKILELIYSYGDVQVTDTHINVE